MGYDADGNMVSAVLDGTTGTYFTYDSANRLISAGGHTYTYNAEDVRIRNLCSGEDTKYTYNTNCRLSKLLWKDTNGTVTKYVYGRGLIGEETGSSFTTYHFDCRGSTVALTDANGNITDTFAYDTYGGLISRTGTSSVIFLYNGRDGVVTDTNGLIYMRARYYSPDMRRFINADIISGDISDSTSLNRYAYVNGNPVMCIDPTGYFGIITLMLIGAGIGAVVGAIGSVVSQKVESEINNEEFKLDVVQVVSDTVWGAIDGAVAFSPLGPTQMAIAGVATSVLSSVTDEFIDDEAGFNVTRVGQAVVADYLLGKVGVDFTNGVNVSKALKTTTDTIEDLARRKNRKWAEKQAARLMKDFSNLFSAKVHEEFFNGFIGMGTDYITQKGDAFFEPWIKLPKCLDDGIVIPRK